MEGNVNLNQENSNFSEQTVVDSIFSQDKVKTSSFYTKVYLYFGLGLLVTAAVTTLLSFLFEFAFVNDGQLKESFGVFYLVMCLVSFFVLMGTNMMITTRVIRQNKSIMGPFILYSVIYGVFFATISVLIGGQYLLGIALGVTALIFLAMCGFGYLSHNKMNSLMKIVSTLVVAIGLLCLVNLVILPFAFFGGNYGAYFSGGMIYWIIEAVFFVVFLLYTAIDFARIRKIAESGCGTSNIALYCAYTIYTDFIAVFTYVLRFILMFAANNNRD